VRLLKNPEEFGILKVMIKHTTAGYEEIAHTADLEIRVWGKDLVSLFRQAAAGMIQLSGVEELEEGISSVQQNISIEAMDFEGLLILFLEELLYRLTEDYMVYEIQKLSVTSEYTLKAELKGAQIKSYQRDIKAVTYHNLNIKTTADGYEVNIVFDI
jgi:SHS2 domain-containing protein